MIEINLFDTVHKIREAYNGKLLQAQRRPYKSDKWIRCGYRELDSENNWCSCAIGVLDDRLWGLTGGIRRLWIEGTVSFIPDNEKVKRCVVDVQITHDQWVHDQVLEREALFLDALRELEQSLLGVK